MFLVLRKLGLEREVPFPLKFQKFVCSLEVSLSSDLKGVKTHAACPFSFTYE